MAAIYEKTYNIYRETENRNWQLVYAYDKVSAFKKRLALMGQLNPDGEYYFTTFNYNQNKYKIVILKF